MRSERYALVLFIVTVLLPSTQAWGQKYDAKGLMYDAIDACERVKSASYSARYIEIEGPEVISDNRADIITVRDTSVPGLGARVRASLPNGWVFAFDGSTMRILKPNQKILTVVDSSTGPVATAISYITGTSLGRLIAKYLIAPYNVIDSDSLRIADSGSDTVGGITCRIVHVDCPDNEDFSGIWFEWHIAIEDKIPRKIITHVLFNGQPIIDTLEITNLHFNWAVPRSTFTVKLPKGYVLDREKPAEPKVELLAVGQYAPEWNLPTPSGDSLRLTDLRPKVVVLDFWYTTCGPCLRSMPELQRIYEQFANRNVAVIGVNCKDRNANAPANLMKTKKLTYRLVLNGDSVAKAYRVTGFPALYVIGGDGRIIFRSTGYRENLREELTILIDKYLRDNDM